MSERDIILLLSDIKAAIHSILDYTKNYDSVGYLNDLKTQHAVERNFEIIGEAASRVPPSILPAL
jgi:uncharacterized protein with HEPN domain